MAGILVVIMAGATVPAPLYVIYGDTFEFGDDVVTLIFATQAFCTLATLSLGRLFDRYGRRRLLSVALALAALSSVLFLLARGVPGLVAARAVSGVALGIGQSTAAAALVELQPAGNVARASVLAIVATTLGLGGGALVAGGLAEYAPAPTRLPFLVYFVAVAAALLSLRTVPETVPLQIRRPPRTHHGFLPRSARWTFAAAGCVGFVGFAMQSLFTALASSMLADSLQVDNHALAGGVVFLVFAVGAAGQVCLRGSSTGILVAIGLSSVLVALASVVVAFARSDLALFLLGASVGGAGAGIALLGSIIVVNTVSYADRRAEALSRYNVVAYLGVMLPVLALGSVSEHTNMQAAAIAFSVLLAGVSALGAAVLVCQLPSTGPANRQKQGRDS
jgi:MFS family permease